MEEKQEYEKSISLMELWLIIRSRLVWIISIIMVCVVVGVGYIIGFKKTSYTASSLICVQAQDYVYENENGDKIKGNTAEHTKYQYSALLAPEYQKVLTSNEVAVQLANREVSISLGALSFNHTEGSAFFTISYTYSIHGGDAVKIKEQVAQTLNAYVKESIDIINEGTFPEYLQDKLMICSVATPGNVGISGGVLSTILIAFLIGVVLAAIFVLVIFFVDDTVSHKEDAERITGVGTFTIVDISPNESITAENNQIANKGV